MIRGDEPQYGEVDAIADAVRTYPLAPVPAGLTPAIMARVRDAAPSPHFKLRWIDVALGLFGASMTVLVWLVWQWLENWPDWANNLGPNPLTSLDPVDIALGAIGVVGGLLVLMTCLVIAVIVLVPRPVIRLESMSR